MDREKHKLQTSVVTIAIPPFQRELGMTCDVCNRNVVEDEMHFLCVCQFYDSKRQLLFNSARKLNPSFDGITTRCKFKFIMKNMRRDLEIYVMSSWKMRQNKLYV